MQKEQIKMPRELVTHGHFFGLLLWGKKEQKLRS